MSDRSLARVARHAWGNVGFLSIGVIAFYLVFHAFDPPRLNWGDPASDYNTLTAGRNFARYGFTTLRFTPLILDRSVVTPADSAQGYTYTHYPPLPDLANGAMRAVFGLSTLPQFRIVALAFSFASLWFVYGLVSSYWSRQTAQVALALWVTNPIWIQHADYLHHGPYGAFFGFGSLWFLARWLRERRRADLPLAGVFLFFAYLSSYDLWIFTPLLMAAMTFHAYRGQGLKPAASTLGFLAAFAVLAVVIKFGTSVWALQGFSAFWRDLRYQAVERSTNSIVGTDFDSGLGAVLFGRINRFFSVLLFPMVAFWLLRAVKRSWPFTAGQAPNPLIVLGAALPFLIVFRELWVAQYYPALMIVPFYAIGFGALITLATGTHRWPGRAFGLSLLAALTWNALDDVGRFKRAFFAPQDIQAIRDRLDAEIPRGERVMTNHMFADAYRYFLDRNIVPLIMHPAPDIPGNITHFSNPATNEFARVVVQHHQMPDEMFDKGYYWVLARYRFWSFLGDPRGHRREIDGILASRDQVITRESARRGTKLYENASVTVWRLPPSAVSAR